MVYMIVQWVLISLILIILVDHLFTFFKDTLTIPKVKDLVNQPSESYREIEKTLNSANNNNNNNNNNDSTNINDLKTNIDKNEMKNELKNFFDNLKNDTNNTNNINNINNSFVKPTTYSEF